MLCEAGEPAVSSEMFTSSLSTSEPEDAWCCLIPSLLHDCGSFTFRTRMFMALFCWNLSLEDGALHKLFYQKQAQVRLLHLHGLWEAFDDGPKSMPQLEAEMLFSLASIFHLSRREPCIDVDLPHTPKEVLNYPFAEYP